MTSEEEVRQIVSAYADALTRLPNVVGLGVVAADAANPEATPVIAVYVERKVPEEQLPAGALVPKRLAVTVHGNRVEAPTRVIEVGEIRPGALRD
jgi:hypothetical protein